MNNEIYRDNPIMSFESSFPDKRKEVDSYQVYNNKNIT